MESQGKSFSSTDSKEESKAGEHYSSFKAIEKSSFLDYSFVPDSEKLNKAFDTLFEKVIKED